MTKLSIILFLILVQSNLTFCKVFPKSFGEQCRDASEIFSGKVTKITMISDGNFKRYKVSFIISKMWKGNSIDTLTCVVHESLCSFLVFQLDKKYLVYSENDTINVTRGRSFESGAYREKSEIFKLNIRYLFRRPHKKEMVKNLHSINNAYFDIVIFTREKFYAILNRKTNMQNDYLLYFM